MRSLAHPKTILVVDDINFSDVSQAWERCLQEGVVKDIKRYTEDTGLVIGEYCFQ